MIDRRGLDGRAMLKSALRLTWFLAFAVPISTAIIFFCAQPGGATLNDGLFFAGFVLIIGSAAVLWFSYAYETDDVDEPVPVAPKWDVGAAAYESLCIGVGFFGAFLVVALETLATRTGSTGPPVWLGLTVVVAVAVGAGLVSFPIQLMKRAVASVEDPAPDELEEDEAGSPLYTYLLAGLFLLFFIAWPEISEASRKNPGISWWNAAGLGLMEAAVKALALGLGFALYYFLRSRRPAART